MLCQQRFAAGRGGGVRAACSGRLRPRCLVTHASKSKVLWVETTKKVRASPAAATHSMCARCAARHTGLLEASCFRRYGFGRGCHAPCSALAGDVHRCRRGGRRNLPSADRHRGGVEGPRERDAAQLQPQHDVPRPRGPRRRRLGSFRHRSCRRARRRRRQRHGPRARSRCGRGRGLTGARVGISRRAGAR